MYGNAHRHCIVLSSESSRSALPGRSVLSDSANPMDCSLPAPLSKGFTRQKYWSGLPCPPPVDLPNPGTEPRSPALQAGSLPSEPPGKPKKQQKQNETKQETMNELGSRLHQLKIKHSCLHIMYRHIHYGSAERHVHKFMEYVHKLQLHIHQWNLTWLQPAEDVVLLGVSLFLPPGSWLIAGWQEGWGK